MYCPDCGEPIEECECELLEDLTPELDFDDEEQFLAAGDYQP